MRRYEIFGNSAEKNCNDKTMFTKGIDISREDLEQTWNSNPEIHAEFGKFCTFAAYKKAMSDGRVRITKPTAMGV